MASVEVERHGDELCPAADAPTSFREPIGFHFSSSWGWIPRRGGAYGGEKGYGGGAHRYAADLLQTTHLSNRGVPWEENGARGRPDSDERSPSVADSNGSRQQPEKLFGSTKLGVVHCHVGIDDRWSLVEFLEPWIALEWQVIR